MNDDDIKKLAEKTAYFIWENLNFRINVVDPLENPGERNILYYPKVLTTKDMFSPSIELVLEGSAYLAQVINKQYKNWNCLELEPITDYICASAIVNGVSVRLHRGYRMKTRETMLYIGIGIIKPLTPTYNGVTVEL